MNSVSRQLWLLYSEPEQLNIQNPMNLSKIHLEKHKQLVSKPGITSSPCHIITNYIWQAVSASFNFNNYKITAATVKSITCMCILKIATFFLKNCQNWNSERFLRFLPLKRKMIWILSVFYDSVLPRKAWEVIKISLRLCDPGPIGNWPLCNVI